jgi:hypothetical protein
MDAGSIVLHQSDYPYLSRRKRRLIKVDRSVIADVEAEIKRRRERFS